jgi:hypothetical protein
VIVVVLFPPVSISNSRERLAAGAPSQAQRELAIRIEQQRSKIQALELAAEERRRSNDLCIQEQTREAESIKQYFRQQQLAGTTHDRCLLSQQQDELRQINRSAKEEAGALSVLPHKTAATQGAEISLLQRRTIFNHYQGVHRLDMQACDKCTMKDASTLSFHVLCPASTCPVVIAGMVRQLCLTSRHLLREIR